MRRYEQMHVIGHQDVRVNIASMASCEFRHQRQVVNAITGTSEAGAAIHATLPDVQGFAGDFYSPRARHTVFSLYALAVQRLCWATVDTAEVCPLS